MVWPAIISAGASLLGGAVSAFGQSRAQNRSEDFSREMYEYALTHGPSLEMQGLRAAGINPMLRYGSGGSSTPVTMPTMSFGNAYGSLGDAISGAGSSAFSALTAQQGIEESRQRVSNLQAELPKIYQETTRIAADTQLTLQQRENALAENGRILQQTALAAAEEYARYASANLSEAQASAAYAMVGLLSQQLSTEEYRTQLERYNVLVRSAEATIRGSEAVRAGIDSSIYSSSLGRWLRETVLMREATGASGLVGVGQAAINSAIEGIQQLFE